MNKTKNKLRTGTLFEQLRYFDSHLTSKDPAHICRVFNQVIRPFMVERETNDEKVFNVLNLWQLNYPTTETYLAKQSVISKEFADFIRTNVDAKYIDNHISLKENLYSCGIIEDLEENEAFEDSENEKYRPHLQALEEEMARLDCSYFRIIK